MASAAPIAKPIRNRAPKFVLVSRRQEELVKVQECIESNAAAERTQFPRMSADR